MVYDEYLDMKSINSKDCKPIINGFTCNVSLDQLNNFAKETNFEFKKKTEQNRTRIDFIDNGNVVASAIKYKESNAIQLVGKKIDYFLKK